MFDDIPQLDPLLWQIDPASNHRSKKCSFIRRKKYCAGDLLSLISTWHLLAFHMTIFFLKLLTIVSAYRQHIQPIFTEAIGPLQELELISRELSNLVGDDKLCLELFQKLLNLILEATDHHVVHVQQDEELVTTFAQAGVFCGELHPFLLQEVGKVVIPGLCRHALPW